MPVDFIDLPTHAIKKVNKKHQSRTKRKYSDSFSNPGAKKFRSRPALQGTDTENAEKIPLKQTKHSFVDRTSGNHTDSSSEETNDIDKTVDVWCPSIEVCQLEKESAEKCIESMTRQNSSCLRTDGNYAVDNHDKYTRKEDNADDDGTVTDNMRDVVEAETGDESNNIDECDNSIKEEEDIVIKLEPNWDSGSDIMDIKGRIISEGYSDDSLSNLDKTISRPSNRPRNPPGNSAFCVRIVFAN